MKVLILGRNPSRLNINPKVAFEGARCQKTLQSWLYVLGIENAQLCNCTDDPYAKFTGEEIPRYASELMKRSFQVLITVGCDAAKVARHAGLDHFELPHPSGRNRKLNDPLYLANKLHDCFLYLCERLD